MSWLAKTPCDRCAACERRLAICNARIDRLLKMLDELVEIIRSLLLHEPTGIRVIQVTGGITAMAITGIQAGGAAGTFTGTPQPAGSVFPAGTTFTWTSDDPNVVLTPSADGTSVTAQTPATDTAASFNLTDTSSFNGVAGSVSVPILPAAVQTPTSISIDQTA